MFIRASHTGEDGFDIVVDSSRKAEIQQALEAAGAQTIGDDTFEILRVEARNSRVSARIWMKTMLFPRRISMMP
jgi:glycine cleavage system aminomethyltransferase T